MGLELLECIDWFFPWLLVPRSCRRVSGGGRDARRTGTVLPRNLVQWVLYCDNGVLRVLWHEMGNNWQQSAGFLS
jgi:hypothetical protein